MKTDISNSARSADGSQCSVLGPPVTACMQMLHEEELVGDDASGLLPRLSGTEHTHTNDKNSPPAPVFQASAVLKILSVQFGVDVRP